MFLKTQWGHDLGECTFPCTEAGCDLSGQIHQTVAGIAGNSPGAPFVPSSTCCGSKLNRNNYRLQAATNSYSVQKRQLLFMGYHFFASNHSGGYLHSFASTHAESPSPDRLSRQPYRSLGIYLLIRSVTAETTASWKEPECLMSKCYLLVVLDVCQT